MRLAGGRGILGCALAIGIACAAPPSACALTGISYPDFSSVSGLQLNGSAIEHDAALQLTDSNQNQKASAYSTTKIAPGQSFATSFELSMTSGGSLPADGIAFLLQSAGPTALTTSSLGSSLGYEGILPSVAVEFDIFNGDPGDPGYVSSGAFDPADQHVAITRGGDPTHHLTCATVRAPPDPPCTATLSTQLYGALVFAWVDYESTSHQLSVYVAPKPTKPVRPTLSTTIDLGSALGAFTFAGFTAATGQTFARQEVVNWRLVSGLTLPVALDSDHDGIPDGSDRCPVRAGGRYDGDHDGCPGPYRRMHIRDSVRWVIPRRGVQLSKLILEGVPHGSAVVLKCPSCHITERRRAGGTKGTKNVRLTRILGRTLLPRHGYTIAITAPGYIGLLLRITALPHGPSDRQRARANNHPLARVTRCLPAGSRKPARHCPTRPA